MSSASVSPPRPTAHLTLLWDIGVVSRLTGVLLDDALAAIGLTAREFFSISLLAAQGPLTPSQFAERSGIPAPTVSRLLRRYASRGIASESAHPTDGRSRIWTLTDQGRRAVKDAQAGLASILRPLYDALGAEAADVQWSVRRLERALRQVGGLADSDVESTRHRMPHWLRYSGESLTHQEEDEALRYIQWLVARRS